MKEIICVLFVITLFFASVIYGGIRLDNYINNKKCSAIADKLNVQYSYNFFSGCFFKINNKWIPENTLQNVNLLKENN